MDSVYGVRCPFCSNLDDKVVDSRTADDGAAIRRRRECLGCGNRYTTFERLEESAVFVEKRSGERQPFSRSKVVEGIRAAAKNRPVSGVDIEALATEVEEYARSQGPVVSSEKIGVAVLDRLGRLDDVAYLRFASVYKEFAEAEDFRREAGLLSKAGPPKDGTRH